MVVREIAAECHLLDLCGLASYHVILTDLPRHFISNTDMHIYSHSPLNHCTQSTAFVNFN